MLTHLFTPTQCAQCKLCCNFRRTSAWETPALDTDLADRLQAQGIPLQCREDGSYSFHLTYRSDNPDETANCPMLDPAVGCMLPRNERPFECRIWPLRLMKDASDALVLGLYLDCPALTPSVRQKLTEEATGPMLPMLLEQARLHPQIVRPLDPAYTVIRRFKS